MLSIDINKVITITINPSMLTIHDSYTLLTKLKNTASMYKQDIIIDLENVLTLDSSIIATFIEFNNYLKETNRVLTLTNLGPFVKKVFEVIHISNFFNIK